MQKGFVMTVQVNQVDKFRTVYDGAMDVHVVRDGDRYLVAQEYDEYGDMEWAADFCGRSLLTRDRYGNWEVDTCCSECDNGVGDRVAGALNAAAEFGADTVDVFDTLRSRGVSLAVISYNRGISMVVDYGTYDDCTIVVAEFESAVRESAFDQARFILGRFSPWKVGEIDVSDVENVETLTVEGCDDVVHGFVWDNVDDFGMSSPTERELLQAL